MHYLDLRVFAMAEGEVTLAGVAYLGTKVANFGVLGPNFRRFFWVKITVVNYYVTKKWLYDIV